MRAFRNVVCAAVSVLGAAHSVFAVPCQVPTGSHPTIQSAVADISCTEIELVEQAYAETVIIGRTLELSGVSSATSIIVGRMSIRGSLTSVIINELTVDGSDPLVAGCFQEAVTVEDGAQMSGINVVVINSDGAACLLFEDGFEDGTTGAWSNAAP